MLLYDAHSVIFENLIHKPYMRTPKWYHLIILMKYDEKLILFAEHTVILLNPIFTLFSPDLVQTLHMS